MLEIESAGVSTQTSTLSLQLLCFTLSTHAFAKRAFTSCGLLLTNIVFCSDASASTLDRLDVLSNRVVGISNDVNYLKEGIDCISIDLKDTRDAAFNTSDGMNSLLFVQRSGLITHQR